MQLNVILIKKNDLKEFKNILELFYRDIIEIKSNNEGKEKDIKKEQLVLLWLLNYMISLYNSI